MIRILGYLLFFLILTSIPLSRDSDHLLAASFTRNLSLGMTGPDVLLLQKTLNADPRTQIAISGVGSPGSETSYFGAKTAAAVKKFQELNASEVLFPVGLSRGTGYVGEKSRAKLEQLITKNDTSPIVKTIPDTPGWQNTRVDPKGNDLSAFQTGLSKWEKPILISPSSYEVSPGDTLKITGGGFLSENTVLFGDTYTLPGFSSSGTSISIRIPLDAPLGKYVLRVKNLHGTTESKTPLVIKDKNTPSPVITGITPTEGTFGTMVTLTGTGFTATGNDIRGAVGLIENIPSPDGKTLTFTINQFPNLFTDHPNASSSLTEFTWKMRLLVVSSNGITREPAIFTLKR